MSATVIISPITVNVDEFTNFSQLFTITGTPPVGDLSIWYTKVLSITIDPKYALTNVIVNTPTVNTLTLSGVFNDVFSRPLKFIDANDKKNAVDGFHNLPQNYLALYSYTAPTATTFTVNFTINVYYYTTDFILTLPTDVALNTYVIPGTFVVRNNWQVANTYFFNSIISGSSAILAASMGY